METTHCLPSWMPHMNAQCGPYMAANRVFHKSCCNTSLGRKLEYLNVQKSSNLEHTGVQHFGHAIPESLRIPYSFDQTASLNAMTSKQKNGKVLLSVCRFFFIAFSHVLCWQWFLHSQMAAACGDGRWNPGTKAQDPVTATANEEVHELCLRWGNDVERFFGLPTYTKSLRNHVRWS